jgi:hypothetical protein
MMILKPIQVDDGHLDTLSVEQHKTSLDGRKEMLQLMELEMVDLYFQVANQ